MLDGVVGCVLLLMLLLTDENKDNDYNGQGKNDAEYECALYDTEK